MSEHTLVRVTQLCKRYSRSLKTSIKTGAASLVQSYFGAKSASHKLASDEFWALRDVSFELRRGEVLGIIGHNGAGKSTLLKCIAGKLKPDTGSIQIIGEMGHLLEMNAGFDPVMTGRENVRLRGTLMGLSGKKLEHYIQCVAEFSELDEFFDSPVQFYSSGMKSRLGFSASSAINPDVLILDEVLAVGDLQFRLKCYERINDLAKNSAVIFVSHSLGQIARMCSSAIYLERGQVKFSGDVQSAIAMYQEHLGDPSKSVLRSGFNPELVRFQWLNRNIASEETVISYGDSIALEIDTSRISEDFLVRVLLRDSSGALTTDWNSQRSECYMKAVTKRVVAALGVIELNPGAYSFSIQIMDQSGVRHICVSEGMGFQVRGIRLFENPIQRTARWIVED